MTKKKQFPLWFEEGTKALLKEVSEKTEYSMARIVTIAVENLLLGRHEEHAKLIRKISKND